MFHHSITNHEPISSNYQNQKKRENYQLYAFSKKQKLIKKNFSYAFN